MEEPRVQPGGREASRDWKCRKLTLLQGRGQRGGDSRARGTLSLDAGWNHTGQTYLATTGAREVSQL